MKKNINLAFYILKANLPKENLKIDNILGKNINFSKNLKLSINKKKVKERLLLGDKS